MNNGKLNAACVIKASALYHISWGQNNCV